MSDKLSEQLCMIAEALETTNPLRGRRIAHIARKVAALEQRLAAEQADHDQMVDIVIYLRQLLAAKDAEIARLRSPQWIALADQEPPECEEVLLYGPEHGVVTGHLNTGAPPEDDWWIRGEWQSGVTHWAALPLPPAALAETPAAPGSRTAKSIEDVRSDAVRRMNAPEVK